MTIKILTILAVAGCLAACVETSNVSADFGNSARSLVTAQTANPETLTNPGDATITGVDPDYANNVVEEMRKDVPKAEKIRKPLEISLAGENTSN
jgi:hypothetical protein